ncbi:hypothetical protein, conserved [Trypanosoma brucei brucei TREU927]|uniref:Anaphase-promoting complex subunit 4-like WD40 domain-containing protein n=1 Tax=Trypanosoma brucei brucei (strain 927/4 GUTat10.1) TaxID=185431 RepID=Q385K9_TRYB2|nr:hypothetical protein, conserved [Trypanosoma brucei brucei TREU927]EAN79522.1 hypothetical protein, conserved [Trypanosoma brucei brucei TREU927]
MKILHTRAAAEPILLATTCHNMNLLAVVTKSLVVVYRSTTLTVVTQFALSIPADETSVCACWSPSGRLLVIGLQNGEAFLLDVESGDLVRRFVPRSDAECSSIMVEDISGGTAPAPAAGDADNDGDDEGVGKSYDPLRQPPVLFTSMKGAIMACTWTTVASQVSSTNRHQERCLPLRTTVLSPILDELEREDETPVLILLDQEGGLSFLPGGMREVCFVPARLPVNLTPNLACVDTFVVCKPSTAAGKEGDSGGLALKHLDCATGDSSKRDADNAVAAHVAYLVVRRSLSKEHPHVIRFDLSPIIASATRRDVVSVCCIAEYCRMGRDCFLYSLRRWTNLICTVHNDMFLPKNAMLLRDSLVEEIAHPQEKEVMKYFNAVNLATLVNDAEELSQQLKQLILQISNVAYRCYDIALHISEAHCADRQRQRLLLSVIGNLRLRCSNLMREMRHGAEREKELLQWVIQRAALLTNATPPATDVLLLNEPLRARWHSMLLRTLHRIGHGESAVTSLVDEKGMRNEVDLAQIVKSCMPRHYEVTGYDLPLVCQQSDPVHIRQCEILISDKTSFAVDGVMLRTVALTREEPFQPLTAFFVLERQPGAGSVFRQVQEWVSVETQQLQLTVDTASFLWSAVVDEESHCVVLWEQKVTSQTPSAALTGAAANTWAEQTLVLALTDENGALELHNEGVDESVDETGGNATETSAQGAKYAVLEVKGISTKHLRVSVSQVRGFGVLYAKERFVVVDFYRG